MFEGCPTLYLWRLSILKTFIHIYAGDTKSFNMALPRSQHLGPQFHILPAHFLAGQ